MQLGTLKYLLNKCNSRLYIDTDNEANPHGYEEYPTGGLYLKEASGSMKFIMGVPHGNVPEYTLACVNFDTLKRYGKEDKIKEIEKTHLALDDERLIWRGWRSIVGNLIRMNYITKEKAQRVFNTYFEPERVQLPRHYINKSF